MDGIGDINFRWAASIVDALAGCGLRRLVLSPGSRSTPLALAALRHPGLDVRVVLDERSAAFFALGMAKASGVPAAVLATSGSAVANWHPAVVEAGAARVPLILLSADRPPELQNCGANQTIDQTRLFGEHARQFLQLPPAEREADWLASAIARAVGRSLGPLAGPVHINIPFREPLLPESAAAPDSPPPPRLLPGRVLPRTEDIAELAALLDGGRGVIVGGAEDLSEAAAAISDLAERAGAPVLADPLSNLRHRKSGRVLAHYDALLRRADGAPRPDWVLRLGPAPVSKSLDDWLKDCGARTQVVVTAHPRWADPQRRATHVLQAEPSTVCAELAEALTRPAEDAWFAAWHDRDARAAALARSMAPPEGALIQCLAEALPDETLVFAGNSMPVRDLDSFLGKPERRLRLFGNRGASGIDGNVSTFLGMAAVSGAPALALLGDLTFLHDLGGLWAARGVDAVVAVLDNGGGGIFELLPQAGLPEFESAWLTPHRLDLAHAARLYGLRHTWVTPGAAAAAILEALARPGVEIVQVAIDRAVSREGHRAYRAALAEEKEE